MLDYECRKYSPLNNLGHPSTVGSTHLTGIDQPFSCTTVYTYESRRHQHDYESLMIPLL
jgi:hypothetical protein